MPDPQFWTVAVHAVNRALFLHPGEFVLWNPLLPYPFTLMACRPLPPLWAELFGAMDEGKAELVTPNVTPQDLARAVGYAGLAPEPPEPRTPQTPGRHLRLES